MVEFPVSSLRPAQIQILTKQKGLRPESDGNAQTISAKDLLAQLTQPDKLKTFRFEDTLYTLSQIYMKDPEIAEKLFQELVNDPGTPEDLKEPLKEFWEAAKFGMDNVQGKGTLQESGIRFDGVLIFHTPLSKQVFKSIQFGFIKNPDGTVGMNFKNCSVIYVNKQGKLIPQPPNGNFFVDPKTTVSVGIEQTPSGFPESGFVVTVKNTDGSTEKLVLVPNEPLTGEAPPWEPGTRGAR